VRVLGIETSCDDTSAAVIDSREILSNTTASQDDVHAVYGGVVPELAARRHLETIARVTARALRDAGTTLEDLDAIAVTRGPGLIGSLLVGLSFAQGLALRTGLPVIGVNHLEGHVLSPLMVGELDAPFLSLLVSGGHTSLYLVHEVGVYEELARTRDDSAGEAFDKAAKMLGLGYPGGRVIDDMARAGDARAIPFPRGRVRADAMAWSFSGLKTALWDFLRERDARAALPDVCASFQEAIVDVLVDRAVRAMDASGIERLAVAGGVTANSRLRARLEQTVAERRGHLLLAPLKLCTDNAAMIANVAVMRAERGLSGDELTAQSRLPIGRRA
jgi:N6-L-threonylcarbamoyladenine synthase